MGALSKGHIAGAVLDVFDNEPLPPNSPLWSHPEVIVTPHVAALSTPNDVSVIFAENLERYIAGVELKFQVSMENGY